MKLEVGTKLYPKTTQPVINLKKNDIHIVEQFKKLTDEDDPFGTDGGYRVKTDKTKTGHMADEWYAISLFTITKSGKK